MNSKTLFVASFLETSIKVRNRRYPFVKSFQFELRDEKEAGDVDDDEECQQLLLFWGGPNVDRR